MAKAVTFAPIGDWRKFIRENPHTCLRENLYTCLRENLPHMLGTYVTILRILLPIGTMSHGNYGVPIPHETNTDVYTDVYILTAQAHQRGNLHRRLSGGVDGVLPHAAVVGLGDARGGFTLPSGMILESLICIRNAGTDRYIQGPLTEDELGQLCRTATHWAVMQQDGGPYEDDPLLFKATR